MLLVRACGSPVSVAWLGSGMPDTNTGGSTVYSTRSMGLLHASEDCV